MLVRHGSVQPQLILGTPADGDKGRTTAGLRRNSVGAPPGGAVRQPGASRTISRHAYMLPLCRSHTGDSSCVHASRPQPRRQRPLARKGVGGAGAPADPQEPLGLGRAQQPCASRHASSVQLGCALAELVTESGPPLGAGRRDGRDGEQPPGPQQAGGQPEGGREFGVGETPFAVRQADQIGPCLRQPQGGRSGVERPLRLPHPARLTGEKRRAASGAGAEWSWAVLNGAERGAVLNGAERGVAHAVSHAHVEQAGPHVVCLARCGGGGGQACLARDGNRHRPKLGHRSRHPTQLRRQASPHVHPHSSGEPRQRLVQRRVPVMTRLWGRCRGPGLRRRPSPHRRNRGLRAPDRAHPEPRGYGCQVGGVVGSDAVWVAPLGVRHSVWVEVQAGEGRQVLGVSEGAPEHPPPPRLQLGAEGRPLLHHLLLRQPIHVVEQHHAGKVTVWERLRNLVQQASADRDAVRVRAEGGEVLRPQVARAALAGVTAVQVAVPKVVVASDERAAKHPLQHPSHPAVGLGQEFELGGRDAGEGADERQSGLQQPGESGHLPRVLVAERPLGVERLCGLERRDEPAESARGGESAEQAREGAGGARVHDVVEEGAVRVPVRRGRRRQQRPHLGPVHRVKQRPVRAGKQLEELVVRQAARGRQLELEQRVLSRVQVHRDDVLWPVEQPVEHVAAARREHEQPVVRAQLQQLAVDTRVLPRHVVDDAVAQEQAHQAVHQRTPHGARRCAGAGPRPQQGVPHRTFAP
eukprot:scaffold8788_cov108-Isochrysis_galbana.AAC.8